MFFYHPQLVLLRRRPALAMDHRERVEPVVGDQVRDLVERYLIVDRVRTAIDLTDTHADVRRLDLADDPWNGRTPEWSTSSPAPAHYFAMLPRVETIDAFWHVKRIGRTGLCRSREVAAGAKAGAILRRAGVAIPRTHHRNSAPTSSGKTMIGELAALKGIVERKRALFLERTNDGVSRLSMAVSTSVLC
jgi:hypothetical protein